MKGPPLGPGGEDNTWPDQVAPRGRKASSTRKIKPQTSNLLPKISNDQGCPGCYPRSLAPTLFIPVPGQSPSLSYRTCP